MLLFRLTTHSNVPAYVQIVQQVRQALLSGMVKPGDRLPTVKEVVAELAINPNTVLRAYRELEQQGLIEGRQGIGTFALRRPDGPPPGTQAALARNLNRWIGKAREAGLDDAGMEALFRNCLMSATDEATA